MDLQAFFNQLLGGQSLGRAPGLGSGQAAPGPGVQPTAPAEGLRALMGTMQAGPNNQAQTQQINQSAPGSLFAGLFDQPEFEPQRSDFQWQPPALGGGDGRGGGSWAGARNPSPRPSVDNPGVSNNPQPQQPGESYLDWLTRRPIPTR